MKDCIMNRDVLELLDELDSQINLWANDNIPVEDLLEWIRIQRSIYGGAQGECAS